MSVTPLERTIVIDRPTPAVDRPVLRPSLPQPAPTVQNTTRIVRRQIRRQRSVSPVGGVVAFACLASAAWAASSLAGQVLLEKARRESIVMQARTVSAQRSESSVREQVDALTSDAEIGRWAESHGFEAPDLNATKLAAKAPPHSRPHLLAMNP